MTEGIGGRLWRLISLRLYWLIMLLLIAFVFFFEFVAEVGGSADPLPFERRSPPAAWRGSVPAPHVSLLVPK